MQTESFTPQLFALEPVAAIRAIHQAWLQLDAARRGVEGLDHGPALAALAACLAQAGHPAFAEGAKP